MYVSINQSMVCVEKYCNSNSRLKDNINTNPTIDSIIDPINGLIIDPIINAIIEPYKRRDYENVYRFIRKVKKREYKTIKKVKRRDKK